jgi:DNA helicase IV
MGDADPFPELATERRHLAHARRCRDAMIARLEAVDPEGAADEITKEYVEVTVADALDDLRSPGAGEFFGRIDQGDERWYVGRRHIEDGRHDPVVVDWRAPIAAPFYRATAVDPLGVDRRRRFTLESGELTAYLDEHLDDPDGGDVAGGIPDPVLAEIGAARTGTMRDIVATIQREQDVVIRSPIDQVLIVQGGPGTGKTAVALHRAAYLLFEHRARLARDGVLVVGPNRAFLDYVAHVLPSLGERSVTQTTVLDLCVPRVEVTATDEPALARWKGAASRLAELEARALDAVRAPDDDVRVPIGARTHVIDRDLLAEWLATAAGSTIPVNQRRERVRAMARRELLRRTGSEDSWAAAGPLKTAINRAWPTQKPARLVDRLLPGPSGRGRRWTAADQLLVDEANSLLNGTPFTYGHVVVDEAQDHSAVALRVIGRRSPRRSMTLVGDVAQSTAPAGQERWTAVATHLAAPADQVGVVDLTMGYRVPGPILEVANRLLPLTGVDATPSGSVRTGGPPPRWVTVTTAALPAAVADAVRDLRHHHRLTGVVAGPTHHRAIADALGAVELHAVDHVHDLAPGEVPLFGPEQVKGLELDGVVVVRPHEILAAGDRTADGVPGAGHDDGDGDDAAGVAEQRAVTPRGARLLYVAMTRAVQRLTLVTDSSAPAVIVDRG